MKAGLKILSFFVDLCKLLQFFLGGAIRNGYK